MRTLASGFALLLLVVPAHAQNTGDARWSRWTGCWELVTENSREGAPSPTAARRESRTPARDAARPQVCVETSAQRRGHVQHESRHTDADCPDRRPRWHGPPDHRGRMHRHAARRVVGRRPASVRASRVDLQGRSGISPRVRSRAARTRRQVDRRAVGRYLGTGKLPRTAISPRGRQRHREPTVCRRRR